MRGSALQLLSGQLERGASSAVRQVHRQHNRHAQHDARHGEQTLPAMTQHVAQSGAQQQG